MVDYNKPSNQAAPARTAGTFFTPVGKLSFPTLLVPRAMAGAPADAEKKYSTTLLIPPKADISALKAAAAAAAKEKFGDNMPKKLKSPFLDVSDMEGDRGKTYADEFDGWVAIRLTSKRKPEVVNARLMSVTDENEIYAGRWAKISVRAFAYDMQGNKGVSFGMNNVQLLDHDTPIAGSAVRAQDEFEAVEVAESSSADDVFA